MTSAPFLRSAMAAVAPWRQYVTWWLAELRGMQEWVSSLGSVRSRELSATLDVAQHRAVLWVAKGASTAPASLELNIDTPDDVERELDRLLGRKRARRRVAVRLDPSLTYMTTLELPQAATTALTSIVPHQIALRVPMEPAAFSTAYRILERHSDNGSLRVAVVVAKRATIERALALAARLGLQVTSIVADDKAEAGNIGLSRSAMSFWRPAEAAEQPRQRRWRRSMELATVLLFAVAYGLYVYRLDRHRAELQVALAETKRGAAAVQAARLQGDNIADALSFLEGQEVVRSRLQLLDGLSRLLPTDSWISQMTLRGRSVELVGLSPRAATLVPLMEAAGGALNPHFKSPVTLAPDGTFERFNLVFEVASPLPTWSTSP